MAGIVAVFMILDKASIDAFLDMAFHSVDLVLWGVVRTPSQRRPLQ